MVQFEAQGDQKHASWAEVLACDLHLGKFPETRIHDAGGALSHKIAASVFESEGEEMPGNSRRAQAGFREFVDPVGPASQAKAAHWAVKTSRLPGQANNRSQFHQSLVQISAGKRVLALALRTRGVCREGRRGALSRHGWDSANDADVSEAVEFARDRVIDRAEYKLMEAIERGEAWAVQLALKDSKRGKDRGYGNSVDITTGGDRIGVEFDYSKLVSNIAPRPAGDNPSPSQSESIVHGETLRKDNAGGSDGA